MVNITRIVFEAPLSLKNKVRKIVNARIEAGEKATLKGVYTEMLTKAVALPEYNLPGESNAQSPTQT